MVYHHCMRGASGSRAPHRFTACIRRHERPAAMKISFARPADPKEGTLVVGVLEGGRLTPAAQSLDEATGGQVARAVKAAPRFAGKAEKLLAMPAPANLPVDSVLLIGLGEAGELDALKAQRIGAELYSRLAASGETTATVRVDGIDGGALDAAALATEIATGALLRSYRFDKYRTTEKDDAKPALKTLAFQLDGHGAAKKAFDAAQAVAEGVFLTRDLCSEPANILHPPAFAERCRELEALGVEVEVLGRKKLEKLGMGALLAVGQGSQHDSQLVVMRWNGGKAKEAPVAFVGKGVTFDTGGISLKPAAGMGDMKWDMGGAGVVTGLMKALAGRKAKVNAVGVIGLVENMPSGTATRPGDVVTSLSGQTIEILNTDAEGRLVLADALWYTAQEFKPKAMIDLATLTGAMIVALGTHKAGFFATDDGLAEALSKAGEATGEAVWRMPLGGEYDREIDSDIADVKNIAASRFAGSIIAAVFLQRFVKDVPWAHLDIAGVVWSDKPKPLSGNGATGYGVRLLDRMVADTYES